MDVKKYRGDVNIFESFIRAMSYKKMKAGLQVRSTNGRKLFLSWDSILKWIDELWDMYDKRTVSKSVVLDEVYFSSEVGLTAGDKFYISWDQLLKFTDELWEIWDAHVMCA